MEVFSPKKLSMSSLLGQPPLLLLSHVPAANPQMSSLLVLHVDLLSCSLLPLTCNPNPPIRRHLNPPPQAQILPSPPPAPAAPKAGWPLSGLTWHPTWHVHSAPWLPPVVTRRPLGVRGWR